LPGREPQKTQTFRRGRRSWSGAGLSDGFKTRSAMPPERIG
jgi:hypothetical protein